MRVRCPHCRSPIEVLEESSLHEINCPLCGSSFSLIGADMTQTHRTKVWRLGQFELLRELGVGKFGTVWMARDTELDRTVAIKIPRKGVLNSEETEMFLRDARAAAQLKHPNIVSVHEVGRHEDTVYIVSDYIKGANLRDWLSGQRLTFRESAELLVKVAEALHHAHEMGVIHRDFKPGNIMLDLDGQPYLIDFGLARREAGEITMTVDGHVVGTPAYMPPEQAKGEGHSADARSDVYSLGVILFELLTGELPFRGETQMLLVQIERDEPPRPRKLNNRIPRDLETITLRAMQKEPSRRYQSAQELADDLKRWLAGEPIVARPIGRLERGWRWCKRRPAVAGLMAAVALLLIAGTTISSYFGVEAQARAADALAAQLRADAKAAEAEENASRAAVSKRQADEEAQRAIVEAQKATRVAEFLVSMFETSAPNMQAGFRFGGLGSRRGSNARDPAKATALELLDSGARKVAQELNDQPAVQAKLLDVIGNVYSGLGRPEKGEQLLVKALQIRRNLYGDSHLDVAASLCSLQIAVGMQLRFDEAADLGEEAAQIRESLLGPDHKDTVDAKFQFGLSFIFFANDKENTREAQRVFSECLKWRRANLGNDAPDTAYAMITLAATHLSLSESDKATPLFMEAITALRKNPATEKLGLSLADLGRAAIMWELNQRDAAVKLSRSAVDHFLEFAGDDHPLYAYVAGAHNGHLILSDRSDEAKEFCRKWLASLRERGSHGVFLPTMELLKALRWSGLPADIDEMERVCRDWFQNEPESGQRSARQDVQFAEPLANALLQKAELTKDPKYFEEAKRWYRTAIESSTQLLETYRSKRRGRNSVSEVLVRSVSQLGALLCKDGRVEDAERLYHEAIDSARARNHRPELRLYIRALINLKNGSKDASEIQQLMEELTDITTSSTNSD